VDRRRVTSGRGEVPVNQRPGAVPVFFTVTQWRRSADATQSSRFLLALSYTEILYRHLEHRSRTPSLLSTNDMRRIRAKLCSLKLRQ